MHTLSRRDLLTCFGAALLPPIALTQTVDLVSPLSLGARGDGVAKDTGALQQAIDRAHERGGGTVHLTAGRYLSGTLQLRDNVSLWLDNGSTLLMSPDDDDFRSPGWTGTRALISAEGVEGIAIFGQGIIDGNRAKSGGPKPITLRLCQRVSIRGITMRRAPSYNISLLGCDYVDIDGVTIQNGFSDGIDPDSSRFVRISNCFVESVDDAIALKVAGSVPGRRSTEHVTVSNCVLRTASLYLKCGTESCGDFRNIAFSNCTLVGGMGNRHGNPGIALYTVDGGTLEDVVVSNIVMHDVGIPLAILRGDRNSCRLGTGPGPLASVHIANVLATGARLPSVIAGIPGSPVTGVRIDGFSIAMANTGTGQSNLAEIPEKPANYPDPTMFGALPAHGLFVRHASDLVVRDLRLEAAAGESRPGLVADDLENVRLLNAESSLWLNNARHVEVECDRAVRVSGAKTDNLVFRNTAFFDRARNIKADADVPRDAIRVR